MEQTEGHCASKTEIDINNVVIRQMTAEDLEAVDSLWGTEDGVGMDILRSMLDEDLCPNKAFVAVYNEEIIGSGFAYRVSDDIGEMGGFFVKPEYRNLGIGGKIWDARMEYLGDRNVAVKTNQKRADKNVSLGFTHHLQDINFYMGVPSNYNLNVEDTSVYIDRIVSIQDANFEQLVDYDKSVVKEIDRNVYLKTLIKKYSVKGYVAYKDDAIVGYISQLPSGDFAAISPWYAESSQVAKALLDKFISDFPKGFQIRIFTPDSNETANTIVKGLGLELTFSPKVLLNKRGYQIEWDRIYSVMNPVTLLW